MYFLHLQIFLAIVALQLADAYTTYQILRAGGRELNPITRALISHFGLVAGLSLVKLTLIILVGVFLYGSWWALVIVALYVWIVFHNMRQLNKQGGAA